MIWQSPQEGLVYCAYYIQLTWVLCTLRYHRDTVFLCDCCRLMTVSCGDGRRFRQSCGQRSCHQLGLVSREKCALSLRSRTIMMGIWHPRYLLHFMLDDISFWRIYFMRCIAPYMVPQKVINDSRRSNCTSCFLIVLGGLATRFFSCIWHNRYCCWCSVTTIQKFHLYL